jgi:hypothetical protein
LGAPGPPKLRSKNKIGVKRFKIKRGTSVLGLAPFKKGLLNIIFIIFMNTKIKTYKIIVDSKLFANIRGSSPAEVAKKAASKILGNSLNRASFSIVDAKTGKNRYYDAKRENLVRPYHKNGKVVKYRIIVKKLGKQIGGTFPPNLENLDDPIYQFFPITEYEIEISYQNKSNNLNEYVIFNIFHNKVECIIFTINIDECELHIERLNKCIYNGTKNLNNLIKYAEKLNELSKSIIIKKMSLLDDSIILENIPLWLLSILSTGSSWYNKFGFISKSYQEEIAKNNKLINMNFKEFIYNECIKINTNRQPLSNQDLFKNKLAPIQKIIEKYQHQNVNDVLTIIKEKLKNPELLKEELEEIIELFKIIKLSKTIKYNRFLIKNINVKKLGKQIGGTYPPNLEEGSDDPIFMFFPRGEYKIEIIKRYGKDCVHIEDCVIFYIENNILTLEYIKKCQSSGTVNLNKIINYAKLMNLESIKLEDCAEILDGISMAIIFILANGISWYNQYGFISGEENFEKEKKNNLHLINLPLKDFLSLISSKNNNNISKFIQIIVKYGFNEQSKVKDIFIKIKELLKNEQMIQDDIKILRKILIYIAFSSIIKYNPELTKKL